MDFSYAYKVFLIGDTQMLLILGEQNRKSGALVFVDVATGEYRELGSSQMLTFDNVSIQLDQYGWLSLIEEIDFDNFNSNDIFTDKPIDYKGELDAYFKLVTDKLK